VATQSTALHDSASPSAKGSGHNLSNRHLEWKVLMKSPKWLPLSAILVVGACVTLATAAPVQIFVTKDTNAGGFDTAVGEYNLDGTPVNPSLITGAGAFAGIAAADGALFLGNGSVAKYTTSGALVNASLIAPPLVNQPLWFSVANGNLFVGNNAGDGVGQGSVGEFTTAGATINANLITGLSGPSGIAFSDTNIFVANWITNTIGEYTMSGVPVNPNLITGLAGLESLVIVGGDLFETNYLTGTVGEYTLSGAPVNPALITGLAGPEDIRVFGGNLYVVNYLGGTVGEYTTAGVPINAALITGLSRPSGIAFAPEPSTMGLLALGIAVLFCGSRCRRAFGGR
jgi:hypothetical protein